MIHLVIPDTHAHYEHNNNRADWLGRYILDLRPDVVIHLGDSADMPSLASYDKGTRAAVGRTYRADINAHLEFNERLWSPLLRAKKRQPHAYFLEGNHEHRIWKAINSQPELEGTISFDDLQLQQWYHEIIPYNGNSPGVVSIDGISYAHYFVSGVLGRPVGGEHPAHSLVKTHLASCTAGHLHTSNWVNRVSADGRRVHGLLAGCFIDYTPGWAGVTADLWWRGVVVKRNVENGNYDPEFISLDALRAEYGT